jgi:hypothetical protein
MKLSHVIILLVCAALLTVSAVLFVFSLQTKLPAGTRTLPYLFQVSEYPGIDAATDIFRLGAIPPGSSSYRTIELADPLNTSRTVTVMVRGKGAEWLAVTPPTLTLPGVITITASPPADARIGAYKGQILIIPGNVTGEVNY